MTPFARLFAAALLSLLAAQCSSVPDGVLPVRDFDVERYGGRWYEIARLDHRFERDLTHISAEYTPQEDGSVKVVNRGYNTVDERWQDIEGRARFAGPSDIGSLKVTFFPPFAGGYHVFELDADYQWALVAGPNRNYLWMLSRTPTLPEDQYQELALIAAESGFPIRELIRVPQKDPPPDNPD